MGLFRKKNSCEKAAQQPLQYVDFPPAGSVCRMDDYSFIVLSAESSANRDRQWKTYTVRGLEDGEPGRLQIGWSPAETAPEYAVTYVTDAFRPGLEERTSGITGLTHYVLQKKNVRFALLGGELRMCLYAGGGVCQDLLSSARYQIGGPAPVRQELQQLQPGSIVSVCLYQGRARFGGSCPAGTRGLCQFRRLPDGRACLPRIASDGILPCPEHLYVRNGQGLSAQAPADYACYSYSEAVLRTWGGADGRGEAALVHAGFLTPAEGRRRCGFLRGEADGDGKRLTFTDLADRRTYAVNCAAFPEDSLNALCGGGSFACADIFDDVPTAAAVTRLYETSTVQLTYMYRNGDRAVCMDPESYEMLEVPCALLPDHVAEDCAILYSCAQDNDFRPLDPSGRVVFISKAGG